MNKFQQALNVTYSQVFTGIAVEQSVVGLAGITTNQMGASFRQYDPTNTIFHLNFEGVNRHQSFMNYHNFLNYYNKNFPNLIVDSLFIKNNGQISIIMNTSRLYGEVSWMLGRMCNTNRSQCIGEL